MKKLILAAALTGMSFTTIAQKIKVVESTENIGGGNHNALEVHNLANLTL